MEIDRCEIYAIDSDFGEVIRCSLGGSPLMPFLIDSGAEVNAISEGDWEQLLWYHDQGHAILQEVSSKSSRQITAYGGSHSLCILASFEAWIEIPGTKKPRVFAKFFAIKGGQRSLLGRATAIALKILKMGVEVNNITAAPVGQQVEPFPFIPDEIADFSIDESVPKTKNAYYHVPAAYRQRAKERLADMEGQEIIEKVLSAPKWISGMSAVPKGRGDFRLVVNMRGPNKAIRRQYHRLPLLEEMQVDLYGSKIYTKLDLKNAFYHIRLSERSKELTTFMTDSGMYRFTRLVFGVNCAPEIFQRAIERVVRGIPGVIVFMDDILIYAAEGDALEARTEQVLDALKENNLSLNGAKCEYKKEVITFLGHEVSSEGLSIEKTKTEAVRKFREPKSVSELKSFLGLASYISTYVPKFADITKRLWEALKGGFNWDDECRQAFQLTKESIIECTLKRGFLNNDDKTILYTDASPYALGAVIVQESEKGNRVISFASKALTATEKLYPQPQREALGIVWGVEHYSYFLLGREFVVRTDAQGIAFIFNKERETSKRVISRAEGWSLRLEAYSFTIEHINGLQNIADPSSRLYVGADPQYDDSEQDGMIFLMQVAEDVHFGCDTLVTAEIVSETATDITLGVVKQALQTDDWSAPESKPYEKIKEHLREQSGMLVKDGAIVIPDSLRKKTLKLAHRGHPGMTAMKSILRSRVWWPRMGKEAERVVETCSGCILVSKRQPPAPMVRSVLPAEPWQELALDYNGPYARFNNQLILVVVDAYSRFLIAVPVKSTDFKTLRCALMQIFDVYGYPKRLKTDNGPPFNGREFREFCAALGIALDHSWPLCPQQNGMAERKMQTVNKAIEIASETNTNFKEALKDAVRAHNSSENRITQWPPEELLWGRRIRRDLPLLGSTRIERDESALRLRDETQKAKGKLSEDKKRRARKPAYQIGDVVVVLRPVKQKGAARFDPTPFEVVSKAGTNYTLRSQQGRVMKRDITHLKRWYDNRMDDSHRTEPRVQPERIEVEEGVQQEAVEGRVQRQVAEEEVLQETVSRRPQREKKLPARLRDCVAQITDL